MAQEVLAAGRLEGAVSAAYYAMLYAARAALSEDDEHARTHSGTWHLFRQRYVVTDAFDQDLYSLAHRTQEMREQGDYEAVTPDPEKAEALSPAPPTSLRPSSGCWRSDFRRQPRVSSAMLWSRRSKSIGLVT